MPNPNYNADVPVGYSRAAQKKGNSIFIETFASIPNIKIMLKTTIGDISRHSQRNII